MFRTQRDWKGFLVTLQRPNEKLNWKSLIAEAQIINIDEGFIRHLHMNFSTETGKFRHID